MQVFVDGTKVTLPGTMANLEEILTELSSAQENNEKTIWKVVVNGKNYNEAYPHESQKTKAEDIDTLEVTTQTEKEICGSFCENGMFFLNRLIDSGMTIASLFRTDDPEEANKHYLIFLESFQYFFYLLHESGKYFKGTAGKNHLLLQKDGAHSLDTLLDEMTIAQQKEDWGKLADVLDYELIPLLTQCRKALPFLTETMVQ